MPARFLTRRLANTFYGMSCMPSNTNIIRRIITSGFYHKLLGPLIGVATKWEEEEVSRFLPKPTDTNNHKVFDLLDVKPHEFLRYGLGCLEMLAGLGDSCAKETRERLRIMVAVFHVLVWGVTCRVGTDAVIMLHFVWKFTRGRESNKGTNLLWCRDGRLECGALMTSEVIIIELFLILVNCRVLLV